MQFNLLKRKEILPVQASDFFYSGSCLPIFLLIWECVILFDNMLSEQACPNWFLLKKKVLNPWIVFIASGQTCNLKPQYCKKGLVAKKHVWKLTSLLRVCWRVNLIGLKNLTLLYASFLGATLLKQQIFMEGKLIFKKSFIKSVKKQGFFISMWS